MIAGRILAAAALLCAWQGQSHAAGERIDVPIKQTVRDGVVRYSIPVIIGGKTLDAMIDTGSTGLRVLGDGLPTSSYTPTTPAGEYSFANGEDLIGPLAVATIGLGDETHTASVQLGIVDGIYCIPDTPFCTLLDQQRRTGHTSDEMINAEVIGNGAFGGIAGISLPSPTLSTGVPNPLLSFGKSWILILPLPGQSAPGHLIINPTDDETAGFVRFPAGTGSNTGSGRDNPLPGCLVDESNGEKVCGPVIFDTGTPGVMAITDDSRAKDLWPDGRKGGLRFDAPDGAVVSATFKALDALSLSRVFVGPYVEYKSPPPRVLAGVEPYLLFDVLYDYANRQVGLKAR